MTAAGGATGVYALNGEHALLALEVLRDRGLMVPDQMARIGCDDSPAAQRAAGRDDLIFRCSPRKAPGGAA